MEFAVALLSKLIVHLPTFGAPPGNATLRANCLALQSTVAIENTMILDASYLPAPSWATPKLTTLGTCGASAPYSVPLCRVQFHTNTSATSGLSGEMWLPDEWNGRFMGVGNRGLDGCIRYDDLDYMTAQHYATVGTNNGHDGDTVRSFLNNPDSAIDFASRAVHIEAVVGKQLVEAYYARPPAYSYFSGCSTGGRQATQAALKHPDDFDGILAGAPAIDFNHLIFWSGILTRHIGAPDPTSPSFIPLASWKLIGDEVLRQCDALDGIKDGIITEPDACDFRPESLLCSTDTPSKNKFCLTLPQVEALLKIYSPLYGTAGELLYPRFDPGAEKSPLLPYLFGGQFFPLTEEWLKYVVFNDTDYTVQDYGLEQLALIDAVNPGDIASFSGDLSAFRNRGGKFLAYHGRADSIIPSGISKRFYNLIARTHSQATLDAFYRLFLIPGMDHCDIPAPGASAPGAAFRFGQTPNALPPISANANSNSSLGSESAAKSESAPHDILAALVSWVEHGTAPDVIVGTAADGATRAHCRYPMRSVWNAGAGWVCVE
ncbi:Carboxylic ester hydrolase [Mycena venus]|uniref:Carboxylic ester hydrolase n=1 Tax=Mycena venus TaxID=2733690 RepID=A0A8H6XMN8_9AGAR|nr:Carboxylic ester hydrolase [Mycena venus]